MQKNNNINTKKVARPMREEQHQQCKKKSTPMQEEQHPCEKNTTDVKRTPTQKKIVTPTRKKQ
jgi:hypothetical protein